MSRIGVAVVATGTAMGLSFLLDPLVHQSVFVLFLGAVTVSAWYGGLGPGLLAVALGGFAFSFFLVEPTYSWVVSGSGKVTDLAIFGLVSLLINALYFRLGHARQQEEAARRLAEAAVRLRDGFLAAAAHDLRNPLTAIMGVCAVSRRRLLTARPHDEARCASAISTIESNAQRLAAQIDELLDVAAAEAGRPLQLRRTPTDLVALVENAVRARSASSLRHQLRLETDVLELVEHYDAVRLQRVIDNLLANAFKYSPLGGKVTVRVSREHGPNHEWAVVAVTDEGLGVPAADVPWIFDPFHRASNVGPISGNGIGLASARHIAEQHGGCLEVTSREGAGSTFTLRLPISCDEPVRYVPLLQDRSRSM
jgi:K+-sensing histidine kinase KdpD